MWIIIEVAAVFLVAAVAYAVGHRGGYERGADDTLRALEEWCDGEEKEK